MLISILTLFPEIFPPLFSSSILGRAQKKEKFSLEYVNIRDFATDRHKSVDDKPYGGGVGMVMRVDIVEKAIRSVKKAKSGKHKERTVLLDPTGTRYTQAKAREYAVLDHLILVCGHYEGVDARLHRFIDESLSIGPYILTGGELGACIVVDSVCRLLPGVLSKPEAIMEESFSVGDELEAPTYTRPPEYKGMRVPEVLLGGDHQEIQKWKRKESLLRTSKNKI